jgi:putative PIN family toxin of toxin-antitoxin system
VSRPLWVLDTNVFISAALTPDGTCAAIIRHAVEGRFTPAWDNRILAEYRDVLKRPRFNISKEIQQLLLGSLPQIGFYPGRDDDYGLPDPYDEIFLAVAIATPDRVIITGNPKHFPPGIVKPHHVEILSPRNGLDRLDGTNKK